MAVWGAGPEESGGHTLGLTVSLALLERRQAHPATQPCSPNLSRSASPRAEGAGGSPAAGSAGRRWEGLRSRVGAGQLRGTRGSGQRTTQKIETVSQADSWPIRPDLCPLLMPGSQWRPQGWWPRYDTPVPLGLVAHLRETER